MLQDQSWHPTQTRASLAIPKRSTNSVSQLCTNMQLLARQAQALSVLTHNGELQAMPWGGKGPQGTGGNGFLKVWQLANQTGCGGPLGPAGGFPQVKMGMVGRYLRVVNQGMWRPASSSTDKLGCGVELMAVSPPPPPPNSSSIALLRMTVTSTTAAAQSSDGNSSVQMTTSSNMSYIRVGKWAPSEHTLLVLTL